MKPGGVSVTAVLDEAAELVPREVAGWAALLALTSLPLRFLEAHFLNRLFQLGPDGRVDRITMRRVSPIADFSFDYQDLLFRPAPEGGSATGR